MARSIYIQRLRRMLLQTSSRHAGLKGKQYRVALLTPNYAMQRSSRVVTPLAGTGSGADWLPSASSAPTARRRRSRTLDGMDGGARLMSVFFIPS